MKIILWRVLLAIGMSSMGLILGANIGAQFFVTKSDGLVGGVMVLWYGVLGAIIALSIGIFLGLKIKGKPLQLTALFFIVLAVGYFGVAVFKAKDRFQSEAGPDSAYEAAGQFTASMERLDLSDPYLFIKMEVDSRSRKWVQTGPGPENEKFTASLRAESLVEIRKALDDVALMNAEDLADCLSNQGPPTKRLRWNLMDAQVSPDGPGLVKKGAVNVNAACLQEHFAINTALMLIERASRSPMSDLKRE